jgi:uncharacterized protein YkwD
MRRACALAAALGGALIVSTPASARPGLDDAVLAEVNFARTHPAAYGRALERAAGEDERSGYSAFAAADDDAFSEALDFLARQPPLPPLRPNPALAAAAAAHAGAQGRTRQVGHVSPDGATLGERLHAHGVWAGLAAEDISYGHADPREVVRQLIVDAGVPGRGHRANIFDRNYSEAGVSCGGHRGYGAMCVIDFAGAVVRR